jgi:hypothetical protein
MLLWSGVGSGEMKKQFSLRALNGFGVSLVICLAGILASPGVGRTDDSYALAPPVSSSTVTPDSDAPSSPISAGTVFNWHEVPTNQEVPINRAVFDQGGYQLYDTVGETIIVPFTNNNLYVMKFGVSTNGTTYFVNIGDAPVLYLPQDGYLENATVAGAKWYPFTQKFAPSDPVYLGVAPNWDDYVDTGWYPDMSCYGGYWCDSPLGVFEPCVGLSIVCGGHSFIGWGAYCDFLIGSPAPFFVGFYNHGIYHYGSSRYWGGRSFHGGYWPGHEIHTYGGGHGGAGGYHQSGSFGGNNFAERTFRNGGEGTFSRSEGVHTSGGYGGGSVRSGGFGSSNFRSYSYSGGSSSHSSSGFNSFHSGGNVGGGGFRTGGGFGGGGFHGSGGFGGGGRGGRR